MNFMDNFVIMILIITFVTTWVDYARPMINKLDFKPFNCAFCLSFWASILSFVLFKEWVLLSTPFFIRIIERRLL